MTNEHTPCVAIVDAISTASMLSSRLKERGFETVHVRSTHDPYPHLADSYRAEDHIAEVVYEGDVAACLKEVAKFRPVAVLAGHDPAVPLTDALSQGLGLPTNGTRLSAARHEKYAMQELLKEAGLRYIPSCKVKSWDDVTGHFASGELRLPVVIKPDASGGSDMVIQCHTMGELKETFEQILGQKNVFGIGERVRDRAAVRERDRILRRYRKLCGASRVYRRVANGQDRGRIVHRRPSRAVALGRDKA